MGQPKYQVDGNPKTSGPGFGVTLHHDSLELPTRWTAPRTIFVNSMSDLFHDHVPFEFIAQVFEVMRSTPQHNYQVLTKRSRRLALLADRLVWPTNVWMGVSIENDRYSFRASHLSKIPSAVRFLSLEPLLGPLPKLVLDGIDWVIVGGESGPHARPMELDWVINIRDRCLDQGVPFFFKQWGGKTAKAGGRDLSGRTWDQLPLRSNRRAAAG
jgi:protein gp37